MALDFLTKVFNSVLEYIAITPAYRVFRSLLFLEYAFPAWGLLAWLVPGLSIRKEALVKIRTMIRSLSV